MNKIILKKNEDTRIRKGHLWIFSNEISGTEGEIKNGDFVEVYNSSNDFIGKGFYNKNSLIAIRLLTYAKDELTEIINKKIVSAAELRKRVYPNRRSYRLVFGESEILQELKGILK